MSTNNKPDTSNSTTKPAAEAKPKSKAVEKNTVANKDKQPQEVTPTFVSRRVWPD